MDEICTVFKGMLDPLFIVFVLLLVSFVVFFRIFKKKSDILILLLCIIFLYGAGIAPVADYLCYHLEKDYINNHNNVIKNNIDVIVVLGHGTKEIKSMKETFSSETGYLRLLHAVAVYRKTGAQYFVCSGRGAGKVSEAQILAKSAETLGVPAEKIRIEPNSKNTGENAGEVNKMFGDKKIKIGLVTSAFHMKRSEREFKKYFDNIIPLPAHYLYSSPTENVVIRYMPQSAELYKTSVALREIIAQWWYRLK
ncbi:MAG: YdcF family protein [Smithella sp.]|jgi:uncharacterized SAM-binding protein YcdF (DUF218 family)